MLDPERASMLRSKLGPAIHNKGLRGSDALLALGRVTENEHLKKIYLDAAHTLRHVENSILNLPEIDPDHDRTKKDPFK